MSPKKGFGLTDSKNFQPHREAKADKGEPGSGPFIDEVNSTSAPTASVSAEGGSAY